MTLSPNSDVIKQAALGLGFDLAGVAGIGEYPELERFPEWIAEGRAGEMHYLEARNDAGDLKRSALQNAAPWAKSVIVVALNYNSAEPYSTEQQDLTRGWISRFAWSQRDYHEVMLPKLRALEAQIAGMAKDAGEEFRSWCYVDTGPVVERIYAKYAGIGWIGKNTCILNQELGSWLFLGVILTSIRLQPDLPAADRCGTCTACLDACPTGAFTGPYEMDATRCIAYLTIEKKGPIPEEFRPGIGRQVFGCDICQDVCPWNRKSPPGSNPEMAPRRELVNPALDWLSSLTPDEFRETFRKSPIQRTKLNGLRRNVVTAMGNSGRLEFVPRLRELVEDEDRAVAEHARWALRRLQEDSDDRGDEKE
ncbi:MAG TPA: tRNA epoxyqueuosine(34) reductase QueG [Terriglobales bacterium]|nr:tRNA epoxyqueuosine(34) reductase QueG [Terriglobales bacterium]